MDFKKSLKEAGAVILILLFTFPPFHPYFEAGLDTSYAWALNFLLLHDYKTLTSLIYPIGPLGFLKMPVAMGNNLFWALAFTIVSRVAFISGLLRLNFSSEHKFAFSFLSTLFVSLFLTFDLVLIGTSIIFSLLYYRSGKIINLIAASFFASAGLYIKSSIGITAFSSIFTTVILLYYLKRDNRALIKETIVLTSVLLLLGLFIFRNPVLLFEYFINSYLLAKDYSSALALFPDNNWIYLSAFIVFMIFFPFLLREKNPVKAYLILFIPLFFIWKHGITRQDIPHYAVLISFLYLFWIIITSFSPVHKWKHLFTALITIMLVYLNYENIPFFQKRYVEITGINNFKEHVLNYRKSVNRNLSTSGERIRESVLEPQIRDSIGDATIDFYPWELSYVAANNLNWQPRKTLQGGAYSRWFDRKTAEAFTGENKPEFLLLHFNNDRWGGRLGSIDNRYLLNDEPITIETIFKNYTLIKTTNKFWLFTKSSTPHFTEAINKKPFNKEWNEWIEVPFDTTSITRVKVNFSENIQNKIRTFFYKGINYQIDYLLADGKILTYRFVKANAEDGLWINPMLQQAASEEKEAVVRKIRLRNSNSAMVSKKIELSFQQIYFKNGNDEKPATNIYEYFNKNIPFNNKIIKSDVNHFEYPSNQYLTEQGFFSGNYSQRIPPQAYSTAFVIPLNSLWDRGAEKLYLEAEVRYKIAANESARLVISVEESQQNKWIASDLLYLGSGDWEVSAITTTIERNSQSTGVAKIYVWNTSDKPVLIDDLLYRVLKTE